MVDAPIPRCPCAPALLPHSVGMLRSPSPCCELQLPAVLGLFGVYFHFFSLGCFPQQSSVG